MKERILYDDEFEKQLKEKADQFKMYPSDKVWSDIYSSMHSRRKRFVVGMSFLIGGILFLAGTQLLLPSKNIHTKYAVIKMTASAKSATTADLRNFNTKGLVAEPANKGDDPQAETDMTANAPFILPAENDQAVGSSERMEPLPETIGSHEKAIQTNAPDISGGSKVPPAVMNLNQSTSAETKDLSLNALFADLDPESSASRLPYMRNDRFSWEIYVTPTVNTHYLNGIIYPTYQSLSTSPIMIVHYANVNGFVDNTPAMGYDVGGNILYRISKNISLKAGLNFSFNRYYIKTYNSSTYSSVTLNSSPVPDTLANFSNAGVVIDKNPTRYQNMYYQLSIPIGVEMKVAAIGRVQLHIGATLQPSYLLNTDSYVLTNDFSRYTKNADVFRRWNMNAGGEAFISYGVGKMRWELGPQIRYQIYSTYKDSYPLKENMLTYGIRFGITKTIR